MINKIFLYDNVNNRIELNTPEILLVREFKQLMDNKRNICKQDPKGTKGLRAFKEFLYIWLAIDWQSIYSDYSEQERHQEALKDSGLTEEQFNNPEFREACRKYNIHTGSMTECCQGKRKTAGGYKWEYFKEEIQ